MKQLVTAFFVLIMLSSYAQLITYQWPSTAELKSDKYKIMVREIKANGTAGAWKDPSTINSLPRDYSKYKHGFPASEFKTNGDHERVGGDAMPSYPKASETFRFLRKAILFLFIFE